MASYEQGYEDDRFENAVNQNFHCPICLNVLKDPVMCRGNQHCFCRPCITRHLTNSKTCPACKEELTPETLSQPPRILTSCLSEMTIRCDYFKRGCREFVQLGNLETHVKNCGFSPVTCSNEGCLMEINKRDRTHHETEVCQFRKLKCHDCSELRKEIDEVKTNLTTVTEKLDKMEMNVSEINVKLGGIDLHFKEVTDQLKKLTEQTSRGVQTKHEQIAERFPTTKPNSRVGRHNIVIAGGRGVGLRYLNTVELFDWPTMAWVPLKSMKERRAGATSFLYNNQLIVTGGLNSDSSRSNTMEGMNINEDMDSDWSNFGAKLPGKVHGHSSVVIQDRLIIAGGEYKYSYSNRVHEISLVPPHVETFVRHMPQSTCYHGAVRICRRNYIVGGSTTLEAENSAERIEMYSHDYEVKREIPPLPYAVFDMATVSWGDNIIVIGGAGKDGIALNTVAIYDVGTKKSHMLPAMKCKRKGCVAVVVGNTIVVMGGKDDGENYLSSVEYFDFERYSWEDLPPMNEARYRATGVAVT